MSGNIDILTIEVNRALGLQLMCNLDGSVVSISNDMLNFLGIKSILRGDTYSDLYNVLLLTSNFNKDLKSLIQDRLNTGSQIIDIILIFKQLRLPALLSIIPIIDDNQCRLLQVIIRMVNLPVNQEIFFLGLDNKPANIGCSKIGVNLSTLSSKHLAVLFLLSVGFSQVEVAKFLGFTRGYIATMIAREICPRFGFCYSATQLLAKECNRLGLFNKHIPLLIVERLKSYLL